MSVCFSGLSKKATWLIMLAHTRNELSPKCIPKAYFNLSVSIEIMWLAIGKIWTPVFTIPRLSGKFSRSVF